MECEIFFAGHGYTERFAGQDYGYIIPYDAAEYSNTYISMEELQTLSRKMGQAKHQLFIMDACYGGLLGVRSGAISEGSSTANRGHEHHRSTRH
jgi:uncharacterized caspase-like protein